MSRLFKTLLLNERRRRMSMNIDEIIVILSRQITEAKTFYNISNSEKQATYIPHFNIHIIEKLYNDLDIQIKNPDGTYRDVYDILEDMFYIFNKEQRK